MPKKGYKPTEEHRKNLSDSHKGHIVSEETKKKIGDFNRGKKLSEEHKDKLRKPKSEEHIKHISESKMGIKMSEETKEKLRLSHLGKHLSEETKRKIGNANRGRLGYKHSKEAKVKMSLASKGKPKSEEHKRRSSERMKKEYILGIRKPAMLGKHHSEEVKIRIGDAGKGRIISKEHKLILSKLRKNDFKNGKFIFPLKDTSIEVKIQNFLKQLGIDFFTHQYMHIEHGYQCDILIPSMNLVIECDGNYWHKYPIGNDIDHIRTKELLEKGFKVLRLWEFEIKKMELEDFQNRILL